MYRFAFFFLSISAVAAQLCACPGRFDETVNSDVIIENWSAAHKKLFANLSVEIETVSVRVFWPDSKSETSIHRLQSMISDSGILVIVPASEGQQWEQGRVLMARNRDYVFEIAKQNEQLDWYLRQIEKISEENKLHATIQGLESFANSIRWFPWQLTGVNGVMEKIASGNMIIESVSQPDPKTNTVVVTASCDDSATDNDGNTVPVRRTASLTLDASNYYLPIRIEDDYEKYQAITVFDNYREVAGIQIPFVSMIKWTPSGSSSSQKIVSLSSDQIPATEFRLPAYGIVEPSFVKPTRPWLLYAAGFVAIVLAIASFWYSRATNVKSA